MACSRAQFSRLEVALGQPTALGAANRDEAFSRLAQGLPWRPMRVYRSSDGGGAGGAVRNVMAIATIADGLQWPGASQGLGLNAGRPGTRGLADVAPGMAPGRAG